MYTASSGKENICFIKNALIPFLLHKVERDADSVGRVRRLLAQHFNPCNQTTTMSDDKTKTDYHDRSRISLSEDHEVSYWTERFGVDKDQLEKLVHEVGPLVKDVEAILTHKI